MKHFFFSFILSVVIASATLSTSSCSKDESIIAENDEGIIAVNDEGIITEKKIVGKWTLERIGSSPWTGKEKTLLFQEDGTITCHSEPINYQGIYAIHNVSVKEGTIHGDLIITLNNDDSQMQYWQNWHYWCTLQNNVMSLNSRDMIPIVDATEYYRRIK